MTTEKEFWEFAGRYFRTLTSIQNIIDDLQVDSAFGSKDARALKSMKRIENVMKDWNEQKPEESTINEECIGCAGPCKVVDVAANLQKELDSTMAQLIDSRNRCDYLSTQIEELKDSNIEGLKELYDVYEDELRGLKADRTSIKSDRDIMFQNYRNTVAKLQGDIGVLEAELSTYKEDSAVLMKVVDIIKDDTIPNSKVPCMICNLVDAYLDAPEGPPETPIDDLYRVSVFLEMP